MLCTEIALYHAYSALSTVIIAKNLHFCTALQHFLQKKSIDTRLPDTCGRTLHKNASVFLRKTYHTTQQISLQFMQNYKMQ